MKSPLDCIYYRQDRESGYESCLCKEREDPDNDDSLPMECEGCRYRYTVGDYKASFQEDR